MDLLKENFKKALSIGTVILVSGFFASCSLNDNTSEATKGYLWKATKEDVSLNLIGSLENSNKHINFMNKELKKIIKTSDNLITEIDLTDINVRGEFEKEFKNLIFLKQGTLDDILNKEEIEKLEYIMLDYGLRYEDYKARSAFGILLRLEEAKNEIMKLNGVGLDVKLADEFKAKDKEVQSLNGVKEQMENLKKIYNLDNFKSFIVSYNKGDREKYIDVYKQKIDSYKSGDTNYMESIIKDKIQNNEFYNDIRIESNNNIVNRIEKSIDKNSHTAIALPYDDFIGEDGVLDILEKKGYKIEKIKI